MGAEYEDKLYTMDQRENWLTTDKWNLGLDFPNLPYYIDGDVKLSQSIAIIRYLARKYNLAGTNETERIRIDLAECQLVDFRTGFNAGLCYNPNFETLKGPYIAALPDKLKLFSQFLGTNLWFAGQNLSYVDFMIYEAFYCHKQLIPNALDGFPNLQAFYDRLEALPNVAAYLKSDKYIKWPLIGPTAQFGGK